jgi:hypothetical protein
VQRLTERVATDAALSVDTVDGPRWDTIAQALGVSEQAARSRLTHYALRRRPWRSGRPDLQHAAWESQAECVEAFVASWRARGFSPVMAENGIGLLERALTAEDVPAPDGWTKRFTDPWLCAAVVDRLTFNGTIIETGTDSYRLASTRARAEETAKVC